MKSEQKFAFLIYNPKTAKNQKNAEDFALIWENKFKTKVTLRKTKSHEDIRVAAVEAAKSNSIPVFMGGDGTFSECLQGLSEYYKFQGIKTPVGMLPGGTGNSFLRDFDILNYEQGRDRLIDAVSKNKAKKIDMGLIDYTFDNKNKKRIFFNVWGMGIISKITERAIKMRFLGSFNYTMGTLIELLFHKPYTFETSIDNKTEIISCDFISISNSRFTGGSMLMAPNVKVDDGRLHYVISKVISSIKLLKLFPTIFKGDHIKNPNISSGFLKFFSLKTDKPIVMNIDGELESGSNPKVSIKPEFFSVYL
ncbi:MAG: diacylglycerol kinase family protein [Spirochaetia bacterium]|nr:diacylglycerol kinase family protein [Spirochaetia bacterium]